MMAVPTAIQIQSNGISFSYFLAKAGQQTLHVTQAKQKKSEPKSKDEEQLIEAAKRYNQIFSAGNDSVVTELRDTTQNIYTGNPGTYYAEGDTLFYWSREGFSDLFPRDTISVAEIPVKPAGFEGKPIISSKQDWALGFILLGWILFASLRVGFGKFLGQVFHSIVSFTAATRLYREHGYSNMFGTFRLNAIFYIILPMSVYQLARMYGVNLFGYSQIGLYLIFFVLINGYFFIKQLFYRITGSIIMLRDESKEMVFNMMLYNSVLGIVLLLVSTVHAVALNLTFVTQWIIAGSIVFFYLFSLFRSIYLGIKKGISIFYLILYLCTLEILPILLVIKLSTGE
jgi:hypothetical protein